MENNTKTETGKTFSIPVSQEVALMEELLMWVAGDKAVIDILLILLDLFAKKESFIEVRDLTDELSRTLYHWSVDVSERHQDYLNRLRLERGLPVEINKPAEENVLDLSDSSIEDLAQKLSDLMNNPNLPKKIYNCLSDELSEINLDTNTPENILHNLKQQLEAEKGEAAK